MEYLTGPLTEQIKNEINKAIAEFCGWKPHADGVHYYQGKHSLWRTGKDIPDYVNSLDAMHDAEECLMHFEYGEVFWFVYKNILQGYTYDTFHIPSRYKAEAFMEVLRRIKESEELDKQEESNENT